MKFYNHLQKHTNIEKSVKKKRNTQFSLSKKKKIN